MDLQKMEWFTTEHLKTCDCYHFPLPFPRRQSGDASIQNTVGEKRVPNVDRSNNESAESSASTSTWDHIHL